MISTVLSPPFPPFLNVVSVGIHKKYVFVCLCVGFGGSNRFFDVGPYERVCSSSKIIIIIYSTQTQTHIVFISNMVGGISN